MSDTIVIFQWEMPKTCDYGDIVIRAISGLFFPLQYPPKTGIFAIIKNHSQIILKMAFTARSLYTLCCLLIMINNTIRLKKMFLIPQDFYVIPCSQKHVRN